MTARDAIYESIMTALFSDLIEDDPIHHQKPLLAHYTSLAVLESIFKEETIWFSNPLFMNDIEEVRFGINYGLEELRSNEKLLAALGDSDRQSTFINSLDYHFQKYAEDYLLDTYVLCCSEHPAENYDGVLSMWRGYGSFGKGAAVVIDTSKITLLDGSPFIIAPVRYASEKDRRTWITRKTEQLATWISESSIPNDDLYLASYFALERFKLMALFSKHKGFDEEREWRIVYMKERDNDEKLSSMMGFHNGPRGVEPMLKFKVAPLEGVTGQNLSLKRLIDRVILGPSASSELELRSVRRMFEILGYSEFCKNIHASTIPFRHR